LFYTLVLSHEVSNHQFELNYKVMAWIQFFFLVNENKIIHFIGCVFSWDSLWFKLLLFISLYISFKIRCDHPCCLSSSHRFLRSLSLFGIRCDVYCGMSSSRISCCVSFSCIITSDIFHALCFSCLDSFKIICSFIWRHIDQKQFFHSFIPVVIFKFSCVVA